MEPAAQVKEAIEHQIKSSTAPSWGPTDVGWVEPKEIAARAYFEDLHEWLEVVEVEMNITKSPQMWGRVSSVPR